MPIEGGGGPHDATSASGGTATPTSRDLDGLIEDIPEAFVLYDGAGRIVYANEEFRRRMGRAMSELVGRRPFEWDDGRFADSADVTRFRSLLDETLATGEPRTFTREQTGLDGERQSYRVSFRAQRDESGHVVGAFMFAQDVSELARARSTVQRQEHEFRALTENLPDVIVRYDLDGRAVYQNHRSGTADDSAAEGIGLRPTEMARPDMRGQHEFEARLMHVLDTGEPGEATITFERPHGRRVHSLLIRAEYDAVGSVSGALVIGRDVTELVEAQEAIARREREFRSLTENAKEFIGRWAPDGVRLYVNPALAALMGATAEELIGQQSRRGSDGTFSAVTDAIALCAEQATPRTILHSHRAADGTSRVHEVQLVPEFDDEGAVVSVLGVGRDVTTVVRHREELERANRTDSLTGAANRRVLYEVLPDAVLAAERAGHRVAVILADLDGFKHLNDLYGHTLGDRLLRAVAGALATCTSADRPVIRLGGDEFVLIADVDSPTDAALIAHGVQVLLGNLGVDDERFPPVDASFGISLSPHDGSAPDELLAAADLALHDAKRRGRGRVEFYRPGLRAESERRSTIEDALRSAVPDVEMELYLQPICSLRGPGAIWGVEALLRWRQPVLGDVSPVEFIPIAEQCGQIVPIGRWVLSRAASIATELNADRADPLRVCVNVSTRQFILDDVVDAVTDALRVSRCDPAWLQLELTESLLLEDLPLVRAAIDRLRSLGVGIAIDDFGTGYSALHYLTKLPIDHMKIDKSFVRDVEIDAQQQEVVRALIALASAIDVEVVAEGIETDGQAEFLRAMGCGLGQGFLLATPMPYPQLVSWLAQHDTVSGRAGEP